MLFYSVTIKQGKYIFHPNFIEIITYYGMLINLTRKPFNRMWFSQGLILKDMFLQFRDNPLFNSGKIYRRCARLVLCYEYILY